MQTKSLNASLPNKKPKKKQDPCLPKTRLLSLPLDNSTAVGKVYLLFAENRQLAEVSLPALPTWSDLVAEMQTLRDRHADMSNEFRELQIQEDGGSRLEFTDLQTLMAQSSTAFDALATALALSPAPAQTAPSVVSQLAKEVAQYPISVKRITIYTDQVAQLSQNYTLTQNLVLRDSKDRLLKFNTQYSANDFQPIATLEGEALGKVVFDGVTGLQFTVLPNTSFTIEFEYEVVPIQACCGCETAPQTPASQKPLPAPLKTALPAPKKIAEPQKGEKPPKTKFPYFTVSGVLLFLVVLAMLFWALKPESSH